MEAIGKWVTGWTKDPLLRPWLTIQRIWDSVDYPTCVIMACVKIPHFFSCSCQFCPELNYRNSSAKEGSPFYMSHAVYEPDHLVVSNCHATCLLGLPQYFETLGYAFSEWYSNLSQHLIGKSPFWGFSSWTSGEQPGLTLNKSLLCWAANLLTLCKLWEELLYKCQGIDTKRGN